MGELVLLPKTGLPRRPALLAQYAREIAVSRKDDLAGFVIFVWTKDGGTTTAADISNDDNPIPTAMLPSWLAEIARRDFITEKEIKNFLRDVGLIASPPPDEPA